MRLVWLDWVAAAAAENGAGDCACGPKRRAGPAIVGPSRSPWEWLGSYCWVAAHTRAATSGAVSIDNAHPFAVQQILLAHNGQVYNAEDYRASEPYAVDSQLIAYRIATGRPLDDLVGYGTIQWVAQRSRVVHLCQVGMGELAVARVGHSAIAWSSSETHLKLATEAAGLCYDPYRITPGRVYLASPRGWLVETDLMLGWAKPRSDVDPDLAREVQNWLASRR